MINVFMTAWKKILRSLGFSESEAIVYLISLEMGQASVQDLAKAAGVSRVTTYAVIESLTERGLMSSLEKGKKKLFVAESPERLVSFVQGKMKRTEATLRELESSLGELKLLQKGEKPVVKFFEGTEALRAIEEDVRMVKPKETIEFSNLDRFEALSPPSDRQEFFKDIRKWKHRRRSIYMTAELDLAEKASQGHEIQVLAPGKNDFFGDIYVYGNKIALVTLRGKLISVLIESEDLAETFRALFELAWEKKKRS